MNRKWTKRWNKKWENIFGKVVFMLLGTIALTCSVNDMITGKIQFVKKGGALANAVYRATSPFEFWAIVAFETFLGIIFLCGGLLGWRGKEN